MNQAVEPIRLSVMQRHRRALVTTASLATLVGLAAFAGYWWHWGRFLEETDDAYVRADWVAISPRIAGYVAQVLVEDNQPVKAGDVLVRIDDRDFTERLNSAQAQLQQVQAAATAEPPLFSTVSGWPSRIRSSSWKSIWPAKSSISSTFWPL